MRWRRPHTRLQQRAVVPRRRVLPTLRSPLSELFACIHKIKQLVAQPDLVTAALAADAGSHEPGLLGSGWQQGPAERLCPGRQAARCLDSTLSWQEAHCPGRQHAVRHRDRSAGRWRHVSWDWIGAQLLALAIECRSAEPTTYSGTYGDSRSATTPLLSRLGEERAVRLAVHRLGGGPFSHALVQPSAGLQLRNIIEGTPRPAQWRQPGRVATRPVKGVQRARMTLLDTVYRVSGVASRRSSVLGGRRRSATGLTAPPPCCPPPRRRRLCAGIACT